MNVIKWDEMLLPYEHAVSELSVKFRSLATGFDALGMTSPIEMVAQRVKRPSSILAKAKRKGISLVEIGNKIEDIAGIRLICRFVEDIEKVVDLIKKRNGMDMTILKERDYISNRKPSGYRSYHMIVKYPLYCALGKKDVTVEIQIRTMAMNYWAVIEHALQYKHDGNLPTDIRGSLLEIAENADKLDKEFSKVRNECGFGEEADKIQHSKQKLVDQIIRNIRVLYRTGNKYADTYNIKFLDTYEQGTKEDLYKLLEETSNALDR